MKEIEVEKEIRRAPSVEQAGAIEVKRQSEDSELTFKKWDEDTTDWEPVLLLDAQTYDVAPLFDLPPCERGGPIYTVSPNGSFAYQNSIVPAGLPLRIYEPHGHGHGHVFWNSSIVLPTLVDLTTNQVGQPFKADDTVPERVRLGNVWMSLSPNEILTQRPGVKKAKKKVVIGGLGLGWFLRKVCDKDEVQEVVVVEKSQELLDWFGYDLCRRYPKVSDVICDDVYKHLGEHGPKTRYLLDIWPCLSHSQTDRRIMLARKRLKSHLWAWGDEYPVPSHYLAS